MTQLSGHSYPYFHRKFVVYDLLQSCAAPKPTVLSGNVAHNSIHIDIDKIQKVIKCGIVTNLDLIKKLLKWNEFCDVEQTFT